MLAIILGAKAFDTIERKRNMTHVSDALSTGCLRQRSGRQRGTAQATARLSNAVLNI